MEKFKAKYLTLFLVFVSTVSPILLRAIGHFQGQPYPFIWSLFLIPCILIIRLRPTWKTVILATAGYTCMKYLADWNHLLLQNGAWSSLLVHEAINLTIHMTIGKILIDYERLLSKTKAMSLTDALTGLYNRRYFDAYGKKMVALCKRNKQPLFFILLDVDHFKKINDNYGHATGDIALRHIATLITESVREKDIVTRMGGEEFSVLVMGENISIAKKVGERIRRKIETTPLQVKGHVISLTVSLGLSQLAGERFAEMVEQADKALYKAKESGRNQLVIQVPDLPLIEQYKNQKATV